MALKFPTNACPFPPVELTEGDCKLYEQRAEALVRAALAEYDDYSDMQGRQVDRKQWRPVKTRENLTVYQGKKKGTGSKPPIPSSVAATLALGATKIGGWFSHADKEGGDWSLPPLLAVGSIAGSLDDVMYGIGTFDATAMFLKSVYTDNDLVDGDVLYAIKTPTPAEPYHFVGLKWIVKTQPAGINAVVWPRDVVYLEATGILERPNGERIGYQLIHSVNLAECDELRSRGVLRATVSSCFLFKQLPKGAVDVYMKAHVEPNGRVSHAIAVKSTAASLIYCWKSVSCAQHKKLAYALLKKEQRQRQFTSLETATSSCRGSQLSSCGLCAKAVGKFRHAITCELCDEPVCSKCRVSKKLSFRGSWVKKLAQRSVLCCTKCVSHASQSDAFAIASDEVTALRWGDVNKETNGALSRRSSRSSGRATTAWHHSDQSVGELFTAASPAVQATSTSKREDWKRRFSHALDVPESRFQEVLATDDELDGTLEPELTRASSRSPESVPETPAPLSHQQQLWLQMAQLRSQAESVYQFTKKSTEDHLNANLSARSLQLVD